MRLSIARHSNTVEALRRDNHLLPNHPATKVKVARSMEELMQAFVVRAAVFMSEKSYTYAEEFDGNDFTATQILGLVGDEPAATIRIRYFAGFAKPERLAVRREFRKSGVAADVIAFAIELCREKGYTKLYGHAEKSLVPFWERFGFARMGRPEFLSLDNKRYIEIERDLDPLPDALTMKNDPNLLLRPEGEWRERSVPDCSVERPALNPTGS